MPNWKYPCVKCSKPVKINQKGLECNNCYKWVHFKCTNLTEAHYTYLEVNSNIPFYCLACKPDWVCSFSDDFICSFTNLNCPAPTDCNIPDNLDPNHTIPSPSLPNNIDTTQKSSEPISSTSQNDLSFLTENNPNSTFDSLSAHSSDFEYADDSDSELRGLNFKSLPVRHTSNHKKKIPPSQFKFSRTINYKFPCLVCLSPCKANIHDVFVVHCVTNGSIENAPTLPQTNLKLIVLQIMLVTHIIALTVYTEIVPNKTSTIKSA